MQGELDQRKIKIAVMGCVAFILVVVAITLATFSFGDREAGVIVNQDELSKLDATLSRQEYIDISDELTYLLDLAYGIDEITGVTATIRPSSYEEVSNSDGSRKIHFLLDVESHKVTYRVVLYITADGELDTVGFSCTTPSVSKYPSTFCVGSENDTTIAATFGSQLPYSYSENGKQLFTLFKYGGATFLSLQVYTECGDTSAHDRAVALAEAWVKKQLPEVEVEIEEEDFSNTCTSAMTAG